MGWRLRNMPGESGRGLNVVDQAGMGGALGLRRSKMRAFRQGAVGRCARATCDCWDRSRRARWVEGYGSTRLRGATVEGVRPLGSGTRLEPLRQIDRILGGRM